MYGKNSWLQDKNIENFHSNPTKQPNQTTQPNNQNKTKPSEQNKPFKSYFAVCVFPKPLKKLKIK